RRKEQNRAAQRAFRERKEKYVKELEDKIRQIQAAHEVHVAQLQKENEELRAILGDIK
ncbi:basic-leucine zipper transcription factor, partial [Phycomyces blakesleeanus NRRL 1555(-)]